MNELIMDLSNIINADILLIDIPFNELRKYNFKPQEKLILNNEKKFTPLKI